MGYFRILYYISYIFNTIVRIFRRNKKFIFILIVITLIFIILNNESQAAYLGDDTYYDPYYAIYKKYDSICIDFIRRFDVYRNQLGVADSVSEIVNKFKTIDYYIYYQDTTTDDFGVSSLNGGIFNDNVIRVVFYETSNYNLSVQPSALYTNYYGAEDNIRQITYTRNVANYKAMLRLRQGAWDLTFENTGLNTSFYIPQSLFHYNNQYIYNYFVNNYSISQIEALYKINNNLDTITDDTVSQDTTDSTDEVLSDSESVFDNSFTNDLTTYNNTFLQTIMTPINSLADGTTTKRISFTLPFVNYTYTLRGDAISSHIRNTDIYTYIQLFWWFAFSVPIFMLLRRILLWLGTGEFINKPSKFALYMSNFVSNNITPGMM